MKRAFFSILFLAFFASNLFGQDYQVIDSLRAYISSSPENSNEARLELAWEYRKSHPDSTIYFANMVMRGGEKTGNTSLEAKALNFLGVAYHYKGDDVQAYNYYDRALEVGKIADSIQLGHALNNLGRFYMEQGDYSSSYDNYKRALEIFTIKQDQMSISYAYKSMAELYITQDQYRKALEMAQRALQLRSKLGNLRGQVSALYEIAGIYINLNDFENALETYDEAMMISSSIQDEAMMAKTHLGIAILHFKENSFEKSLIESKKAKAISDVLGNQSLDNEINLHLGKTYYQLGNVATAEMYLKELLNEAKKSNDLSIERDASYYMALICRVTGRNEEAFGKFERYHELTRTLENTASARLIERLEARIEIETTKRENELLLAQQEADEAIKSRLKMQNILLTGGILMAFAIVLILYLMYKKRMEANQKLIQKNNFIADQREEIKKQNEHIARQNNILTAHNAELATLNNEKDTLMNILAHDLKAPFNRIRGLVQLCQLTEMDEEQKKYVSMLDTASIDGLNLIRDLLEVSAFSGHDRQPEIAQISLLDQLNTKKDYFRTEAESKHIKIDVNLDEDITIASDPSYLSRILDNLISNAIKFSEPGSEVILSGGRSNGSAFLSVKDFGPGFSSEDRQNLYSKFSKLSAQPTAGESSNGLGLAIVKILVDNLNSEIELISEKGKGSEFIISFANKKEVTQPDQS